MKMKLYRDSTTPFTVYLGENSQISIQRHYFIPKSINAIRMYFFVYILLRDRLIPFFYCVCLSDWDDLNALQQNWFDNRRVFYNDFKENFANTMGKNFFNRLKIIFKRCEFQAKGMETKFRQTTEMNRLELISEFEMILGRQANDVETINEINTMKDPDVWLDSIELAAEKVRLFSLGVKDNISEGAEGCSYFGKERENLMNWINKKNVVIVFKKELMVNRAMRLKKCQKIHVDARASKTVTLNDCLSKVFLLI